MALLGKIGRSVESLANSKLLMGTLVGGAVIKGLSDTVGQSAISNAMDIAFDNPEADRAVLGTDITPSILMAEAAVPGLSQAARVANVERYGFNTGIVGPMTAGAAVGGAGGFLAGSLGAARIFSSPRAKAIAGAFGGLTGVIAGAGVGAGVGAGGAFAHAAGYVRSNSQLMSQSPYSRSSLTTADQLNASGDIVLGMHNARRGY